MPHIKAVVQVSHRGRVLWSGTSHDVMPLAFSDGGIEFALARYQCPDPVPLAEEVQVDVEFLYHDGAFESEYGPMKLEIVNESLE